MLSFQISAIDIVLVIAVIVLIILYMKRFSVKFPDEDYFKNIISKESNQDDIAFEKSNQDYIRNFEFQEPKQDTQKFFSQNNFTECPRGFGDIKKLGKDNSVNERCLGCYKIMQCFAEE